MSDPPTLPPSAAPFVVGQTVRLKPSLLEKYPLWAPTHTGTAEIFSIKPIYSKKQVFQDWDIFVIFPGESSKYLLCQFDIEESHDCPEKQA